MGREIPWLYLKLTWRDPSTSLRFAQDDRGAHRDQVGLVIFPTPSTIFVLRLVTSHFKFAAAEIENWKSLFTVPNSIRN
jgi:hypothetical protein